MFCCTCAAQLRDAAISGIARKVGPCQPEFSPPPDESWWASTVRPPRSPRCAGPDVRRNCAACGSMWSTSVTGGCRPRTMPRSRGPASRCPARRRGRGCRRSCARPSGPSPGRRADGAGRRPARPGAHRPVGRSGNAGPGQCPARRRQRWRPGRPGWPRPGLRWARSPGTACTPHPARWWWSAPATPEPRLCPPKPSQRATKLTSHRSGARLTVRSGGGRSSAARPTATRCPRSSAAGAPVAGG